LVQLSTHYHFHDHLLSHKRHLSKVRRLRHFCPFHLEPPCINLDPLINQDSLSLKPSIQYLHQLLQSMELVQSFDYSGQINHHIFLRAAITFMEILKLGYHYSFRHLLNRKFTL
jgi:hypothetical protein